MLDHCHIPNGCVCGLTMCWAEVRLETSHVVVAWHKWATCKLSTLNHPPTNCYQPISLQIIAPHLGLTHRHDITPVDVWVLTLCWAGVRLETSHMDVWVLTLCWARVRLETSHAVVAWHK